MPWQLVHKEEIQSHFLFMSDLVNADIVVEFLTLFGILTAKRVPDPKNLSSEFTLPNNTREKHFLYDLVADGRNGIDVDKSVKMMTNIYMEDMAVSNVRIDLTRGKNNPLEREGSKLRREFYCERIKLCSTYTMQIYGESRKL